MSTRIRADATRLDLESFFPYRLSVVYDEVSRSVAQVYGERFGLSRQQWRVLAVLGDRGVLSAKEICALTRLDKMQVSRAVAQLEEAGYLARDVDPGDRRHQRLNLAPAGRSLYRRIVPLVRERERFLISALSREEARSLDAILVRLVERARELQTQG